MKTLPADYSRCLGHNCDRKDTCLRFLALSDRNSPRFVSAVTKLCNDRDGTDFYIPLEGDAA